MIRLADFCQAANEELERPIMQSNLQGGKCPGPDSFPAEFFQTLWKQLALPQLKMSTDCYKSGVLL